MCETLFNSYDRQGLDVQYNNRERVANYLDYFNRWAETSAKIRETIDCHIDVAFGESDMERLDIFPALTPDAPVCMFVHGGYWQSLDKSDFSFLAAGLLPHDVTLVVNNYALCPHVTMDEIVRQNRAALAWIWANADNYGIDPERVHISGHSAGGHLVAMLMATNWPSFQPGTPADLIKSTCAMSGLYDLEPIRLCYLNEVLRMDQDMAARNSPLNLNYPHDTPMLITHGGLESDEYYRQTNDMTALWGRLGFPIERSIPDDLTHFSLVDQFADPHSELIAKQVALM
tara:strand:+ start:91 stop:951 length:861 start_codon:yes stop_codon:yes gene_type:complete